jgi:uncharacterized protein (TIGR03083 family)
MRSLDYLEHLDRESRRFATAVLAAAPDAQVPTCPEWTADDLLWHLSEVQWFWGEIVRSRADAPEEVQAAKPARPGTRRALEDFYRVASAGLLAALAAADPRDAVWTWAEDHTVGFVRRRQTHESLIHRLDAELTSGTRTPLDPLLACDGVDEALRVMHGAWPTWGAFTPDEARTVRVVTTDVPRAWFLVVGRFTGTDPESGEQYDEPAFDVTDEAAEATATVRGSAGDLNCLLWNRPTLGQVEHTGDSASLAAFDEVLAVGIQ